MAKKWELGKEMPISTTGFTCFPPILPAGIAVGGAELLERMVPCSAVNQHLCF